MEKEKMNNTDSNNPNNATSNDSPVEAFQNDLSGDLKLDDLSASLDDSKSAHNQSEQVPDGQAKKPAGHAGTDIPSVPKKLNNKTWEVEYDFETLHKEFRDEWKPDGRSEEEAVLELTHYTWLKLRLVKSAQLRFFKCSLSAEIIPGKDSWDDMIEWQKKVAKYGQVVVSRASKFMDELNATFEHVRSHHYWTEDSEGKDIQLKLCRMQTDISCLIQETRTKVIGGVEKLVAGMSEATTYLDQAYQPDEIDRQLDLMAKLDTRIEKIIRRLTAIKVFKRVDGVEAPMRSLVESPSVAPMEKSPAEVG
jgi:hypothetical protein